MNSQSYTIDQVSWHTQVVGNRETKTQIDARFRAVFRFLAEHQLLAAGAPEVPQDGSLAEDTRLDSSHLTEVGLRTMKAGYDKWLAAVDKGTSPDKTTILENALRRVLAGAQQAVQGDGPASGGSAP